MKFKIDRDKCIQCFNCQNVCPTGAIQFVDEQFEIHEKICDGCGICAENCPVEAILPLVDETEIPVRQQTEVKEQMKPNRYSLRDEIWESFPTHNLHSPIFHYPMNNNIQRGNKGRGKCNRKRKKM